jgi:hypothetical protein
MDTGQNGFLGRKAGRSARYCRLWPPRGWNTRNGVKAPSHLLGRSVGDSKVAQRMEILLVYLAIRGEYENKFPMRLHRQYPTPRR